MNVSKTMFALALGSVGIMGALSTVSAHAFTLNNGDALTIESGVPIYDSDGNQMNVTGSWFAVDANGNSIISGTEKLILSEGNTGLIIGIVVVVLLCCCCALGGGGWFFGDSIVRSLGF